MIGKKSDLNVFDEKFGFDGLIRNMRQKKLCPGSSGLTDAQEESLARGYKGAITRYAEKKDVAEMAGIIVQFETSQLPEHNFLLRIWQSVETFAQSRLTSAENYDQKIATCSVDLLEKHFRQNLQREDSYERVIDQCELHAHEVLQDIREK